MGFVERAPVGFPMLRVEVKEALIAPVVFAEEWVSPSGKAFPSEENRIIWM
jgi:hypothetical protein